MFSAGRPLSSIVTAGLDPAIHELRHRLCGFPWMPGTRPRMTIGDNGVGVA
jgi:hypothetical protein